MYERAAFPPQPFSLRLDRDERFSVQVKLKPSSTSSQATRKSRLLNTQLSTETMKQEDPESHQDDDKPAGGHCANSSRPTWR